MSKFFDDLYEGLEEIVAYRQGKLKLSARQVEIPKPSLAYKARDIANIRKKRAYSQEVFAQVLNVSKKTIQSWESGIRTPSRPAQRLLEIIEKGEYKPKMYGKKS